MLLLVTYFEEPHTDKVIMVWQRKQQQQKWTNAQFSQYSSEMLGNTGG